MIDSNESRYRQQLLSRLDRLIAQQSEIIALLKEQMGKSAIRTAYERIGPFASDQTMYHVRITPENASDIEGSAIGCEDVDVEAKAREVERQLGPAAGQLIRDLAHTAQDAAHSLAQIDRRDMP